MNTKPRTLLELLRARAESQAEKNAYTFLIDGETEEISLTYGELDQRARAIGARLQSLNAKDQPVLLLYPPGLEYIAAFFGCIYAGAIAVPVYPPTSQRSLPRLWSIVKDAGPRVALTTTPILSKLEQTSGSAKLPALPWLTTDNLEINIASEWRSERLPGNSLAFVQYTSGSTATPKGVMLTHDNLLQNQRMIQLAFEQTEHSIILGWLPLYHDMGLIGNVLQSMYCGARCVLMSPLSFLQRPARWLQAISRYGATTSGGPNFAYDLCVRKIGLQERADLDLRTWTVAFNGAEPIREDTIDRFCATFEPCGFRREAFFPCYGLAEATLFVSGGPKSATPVIAKVKRAPLEMNAVVPADGADESVTSFVGSGCTWLDQEIRIVDPESLRECSPGVIGEIWVAGPHVAQGYRGRPEESESTFKAYIADAMAGPYLRTGDLGFMREGELFVTGRLKDLIIIRGRNYFPHDIELTVERSHDNLRPGGGAAFSIDLHGEEQLVVVHEVDRHRNSDLQEVIGAIRQAVAEEYELQVHAIVLIKAGSLPKTSSGKVQRHACRAVFLKDEFETLATWRVNAGRVNLETSAVASNAAFTASSLQSNADQNAIEEWLVEALATRLRIDPSEIQSNRPVTYYGVDSLMAVELMHTMETSFGVNVTVADLLQSDSLVHLAARVFDSLQARTEQTQIPLSPQARPRESQLSYAQRALWFLHQLAPDSAAYNISSAARIHSSLDVVALQQSLQMLIDRHPALRTTFPVEAETPVQHVNDFVTVNLNQADTSHLKDAAFAEYLREEIVRPFDLSNGPLLRVSIYERTTQEHVLLFVANHMVTDFWSMALLINELVTIYQTQTAGSSTELTPLSVNYLDYSRSQAELLAGAEGERLWHYWQKQLSAAQTVLNLPICRPRPQVQTYAGANERFHLDKELTGKLKQFSQDYHSTLYTTLLAAFQILLYRYTGQEDFLVGSPTSGRRAAAFRTVAGCFMNPVVLRARVSPEMTFESFHGEVRQTVLEALEHEEYPFGLLVERLQVERDPSRAPLFQIMFSWQQSPLPQQPELSAFALGESGKRMEVGGLMLEAMPLDQPVAQFDLTLLMAEIGDELAGVLQYNTDLFDAAPIACLAQHFQVLLADIVSNPRKRVVDLQLLTPFDSQLLLRDFNDTLTDYDETLCLHTLFESQVKRTPEQTAVVFQERQYTYSELNRRANQLAHHLKKLGVGPEVCVGICVERSLEMVVGLLAILKAGGAYLALDPAYPKDRLAYMLADSQAPVLLTQSDLAVDLTTDVQRVCIDRWTDFAGELEENPPCESTAQNLAYVIYTSGSTGRPKGVMISHRNVVNFCAGMDRCFAPEEIETWLAVTSISFDISVLELFWTLTRGFKVVIQSEAETASATIEQSKTSSPKQNIDFSLFYFASEESGAAEDRYRLLMEGAKFADEHDFTAVWTPERHFHEFGGLYSNPALTSAALATITKQVQLRAGSVVLPLHHPIRVAEEWAFVDNLSHGRVAVSFASGWHTDDFVFAPENYPDRKQLMLQQLETVRSLWRGEAMPFKGGAGNDVEIRIHPRPIQPELPFWITTAGHPDTFRAAGEAGANLLTHLLGQSIEELSEKIEIYRQSWRPQKGSAEKPFVTLMLHTFVGPDPGYVTEKVQGPLCRYLASSIGLAKNFLRSLGHEVADELTADDLEALLAHAFDRYYQTSGLFGTPETCVQMIDRLKLAGVDEVACLIDFGVDVDSVIANLIYLDQLRKRSQIPREEGDFSLATQLTKHGVTHLQCTPSLARVLLLDSSTRGAVTNLRHLLLGGEAVPSELVGELQTLTGAQVRNMYGPTETTIWSTTYTGACGPQTMPIGKPMANTSVYVLDKQMAPVPFGVTGELYIGGDGVGRGYRKQPDLSADRFLPDPWRSPGARMYRTGDLVRYRPDGSLEFLGRADEQVKLRGHRIELGEIETLLRQHPSISEAVVAIKELTPGDSCLVAYLVPHVSQSREAETEQQGFRLPNGLVVAHHGSFQTSIVCKEVFEDEVYLKHGIAIEAGDVVFDVGANIGLFTLFARQQWPAAQIYSFEPLPPNFELLQANVSRHNVNARLFNYGLSDSATIANFTFYPEAAGLSGRTANSAGDKEDTKAIVTDWIHNAARENEQDLLPQSQLDELLNEYLRAETFNCPVKTLSDVIREHDVERIDLLKIDVEGSEFDVLSGLQEPDWRRIKQIAIEVHSRSILNRITSLLEAHGFRFVVDDSMVVHENGNGRDVYVAMLYAFSESAEQKPDHRNLPLSIPDTIEPQFSVAEIQNYLRRSLPAHFIPSAFMVLAALPLTPNGKIDRKSLPLPDPQHARSEVEFVAPRTSTESELAALWSEILGNDRFGIHDNFFDSGGHSLSATQLVTRIRRNFAVELSLRDFIKCPTIAGLAELIEESILSKASDEKLFALVEMLESQSPA
jgi:natural product biosynthesis luciferase-like monooxygenase protein/FkbM family methyltransferase